MSADRPPRKFKVGDWVVINDLDKRPRLVIETFYIEDKAVVIVLYEGGTKSTPLHESIFELWEGETPTW